MPQSLNSVIQTLDESISNLEMKIDHITECAGRDQAELFGVSAEEKALNKNIAVKLDSTIERLETLLAGD